uniref:Nucleotidyltransferase n=1 Tax=Oscillatoriales cyanobacterium SpSt-402 TaxID=2282168 RepID=A0A832M3V1_9CYAN
MLTDSDGYLINECHWDLIQAPWINLVGDLRERCVNLLGDRLHSLYLRGSVPRGLAIPNISDLDSVAILRSEFKSGLEDLLQPLKTQLIQQYPFCSKIEIALITETEIQSPESYWQATIQTQGLCIYGEDVRSQLPRFKPGIAMLTHAFDLADDLAETQEFLRRLSSEDPHLESQIKAQCSWITRRMVRTGFELVMEAENTFTRDLHPCYEAFSQHFPEQERFMRKALELAIQPASDRAGLLMFLSHFGGWLVNAVDSAFAEIV